MMLSYIITMREFPLSHSPMSSIALITYAEEHMIKQCLNHVTT